MASNSTNRFACLLIAAFSFAAGFSVCLLLKGLLTKSGWAEALSAVTTLLALILAAVTYLGWHRQKVKEDAYTTKKTYISTLVIIEGLTVQVANLVSRLVPEPGLLVPSEDQVKSNLESIVGKHSDLALQAQSLITTQSELGFWGASLSDASTKDHENLINAINEYLTSLHYLHNSLKNFYIHKVPDDSMNGWKQRFIEANREIYKLFKSRKTKNMNTVFMN